MRFAIDDRNIKIEVSSSGQIAKCPVCKSIVIGRKGPIRPNHWYHKSKKECDNWYEPISEWHLKWQNLFPSKNVEVTLIDNVTKVRRRADIKLNNSVVIEIQNSPIKFDDIKKREVFYGRKGLIWILNSKTLAKKSSLINDNFEKKKFEMVISFPDEQKELKDYTLNEFRERLFGTAVFKDIFNSYNFKELNILNGQDFNFEFHFDKTFDLLEYDVKSELTKVGQKLYGWDKNKIIDELFNVSFYRNPIDNYPNIILKKVYWRSFIDEMTFPVFLDNLDGLEDDCLFWYQKNKIVKKDRFIKYYIKYT